MRRLDLNRTGLLASFLLAAATARAADDKPIVVEITAGSTESQLTLFPELVRVEGAAFHSFRLDNKSIYTLRVSFSSHQRGVEKIIRPGSVATVDADIPTEFRIAYSYRFDPSYNPVDPGGNYANYVDCQLDVSTAFSPRSTDCVMGGFPVGVEKFATDLVDHGELSCRTRCKMSYPNSMSGTYTDHYRFRCGSMAECLQALADECECNEPFQCQVTKARCW